MSKRGDDILARLSRMLDAESPKMARILYREWGDMEDAVTYKELREAILSGELDISYFAQWQQDYSLFVTEHYAPIMRRICEAAMRDLRIVYGEPFFDMVMENIEPFINARGGNLIRQITTAQHTAINVLVKQATMSSTLTVDELARSIRPCVGLTQRQAQYVHNYYERLREAGVPHKKALKREAVYAAKVHRRRADTIAITEMAQTYNGAQKLVIQQAVDEGLIQGEPTKEWLTAADERVCPECGALEGETIPMSARFSNGADGPPHHPLCRCALAYHFHPRSHRTQNTGV